MSQQRRIDAPGVTIISCRRGPAKACGERCGRDASTQCSFALRGRMTGKACPVELCAVCARTGHGCCGAHARFLVREARR